MKKAITIGFSSGIGKQLAKDNESSGKKFSDRIFYSKEDKK